MSLKEALELLLNGEYDKIPSNFWSDRTFVATAAEVDGFTLAFADESIKQDRDFVLDIVKKSSSALLVANVDVQRDREIMEIAVNNGLRVQSAYSNYDKYVQALNEAMENVRILAERDSKLIKKRSKIFKMLDKRPMSLVNGLVLSIFTGAMSGLVAYKGFSVDPKVSLEIAGGVAGGGIAISGVYHIAGQIAFNKNKKALKEYDQAQAKLFEAEDELEQQEGYRQYYESINTLLEEIKKDFTKIRKIPFWEFDDNLFSKRFANAINEGLKAIVFENKNNPKVKKILKDAQDVITKNYNEKIETLNNYLELKDEYEIKKQAEREEEARAKQESIDLAAKLDKENSNNEKQRLNTEKEQKEAAYNKALNEIDNFTKYFTDDIQK